MKWTEIMVLSSGIAWTITYLALVYRGFKDKSYGMPLVPLALNIAWEVTFSLIYPPHTSGGLATVINTVWMIFDVGIVISLFMYGYKYFQNSYKISKSEWIMLIIVAFSASFGIMIVGGPFFGQFDPYFHKEIFEGAKFTVLEVKKISEYDIYGKVSQNEWIIIRNKGINYFTNI